MAAVNFPSNPSVGQQFTPSDSNVVYTWTGTFWDVYTTIATFPRAVSASYAESASIADNGGSGGGGDSVSASFASSSLTASYLEGTASLADTASYSITASYAIGVTSAQSSSYSNYAVTASYVKTAQTASHVQTSSYAQTASYAKTSSYSETSSYAVTASYIRTAQTASYIGTNNTASYANSAYYAIVAISSSYVTVTQSAVTSASFASSSLTASYVLNAETASYVGTAQTASFVIAAKTASYVAASNVSGKVELAGAADTASYVANAVAASTASYVANAITANTASYVANAITANTASWALNAITTSYISGSNVRGDVSSSRTSSISDTAYTASYVLTSVSASYAVTAGFAETAITFTGTASYASTSSWAVRATTASYTLVAGGLEAPFSISSSYEIHVSSGSGNDTTGDGSFIKPFKTIQRAVNVLSSSGLHTAAYPPLVQVHPGYYPETVTAAVRNLRLTSADSGIGAISINDPNNYRTSVKLNSLSITFTDATSSALGVFEISNITIGTLNKTNQAGTLTLNGARIDTFVNNGVSGNSYFYNSQIVQFTPFGANSSAKALVKNCQINYITSQNSIAPASPQAGNLLVIKDSEIATVASRDTSMTMYNCTINETLSWTGSTTASTLYMVNSTMLPSVQYVNTPATASLGAFNLQGNFFLQNVGYDPARSVLNFTASNASIPVFRQYFGQASFQGITGSFSGSIQNATSASYASTAGIAGAVAAANIVGTIGFATTAATSTSASYALTASYALSSGGGGSTSTRIISGTLLGHLNYPTYFGTHSWSTDYLNVVLYRKENNSVTSSLIAQNNYAVRTYANSKIYLEAPYASNPSTYSFFITPVV